MARRPGQLPGWRQVHLVDGSRRRMQRRRHVHVCLIHACSRARSSVNWPLSQNLCVDSR